MNKIHTSWSVFKACLTWVKVWNILKINLEPRRLLFPSVLLESFKKFLADPYHEPLLQYYELLVTIQTKNSARSHAPANTALTQILHWSHNARSVNCHLCCRGERNGTQRRAKVSFGKIMMQALELLWLSKVDLHRFCQQNFWENNGLKAECKILVKFWKNGFQKFVSRSIFIAKMEILQKNREKQLEQSCKKDTSEKNFSWL